MSTANYDVLGRPFVSVLDLVYWGFFGASLALFAVNFVYRYFVISKHELLATFNSWKLFLWLLIPFVFGVIWILTGFLLCGPNQEVSDFLREEVSLRFGKDVDKTIYHAIYLYNVSADGKITLRYDSVFSTAVLMACVVSVLSKCLESEEIPDCLILHHRLLRSQVPSSYHQCPANFIFFLSSGPSETTVLRPRHPDTHSHSSHELPSRSHVLCCFPEHWPRTIQHTRDIPYHSLSSNRPISQLFHYQTIPGSTFRYSQKLL